MTTAAMPQNILTEIKDQIFYITINREDKLNALNIQTLSDIKNAVLSIYDNAEVRGVILTGKGTKAFAAGADIAEFANFNIEEGTRMSEEGHAVLRAIDNCPKPVIAAVNGFALGGGNELAMACHIRVAVEKARFGQPEVNLGITPGYAGTQRLAQLIGKGRALEFLMTADMMDAQTALNYGLVNHVVPADQLIPKCEEILNKIKAKAPLAISSVIRCVNAYYEKRADGNDVEINEFGNFFGSQDFIEGTKAFLEKRPANFNGQ
ncbi:MAG: enoyl-CoA hydratase/isomerase family protein [Bacteroidetes bacterium]|nr:enoyl-CoA hydratase/isomerase family protein [Bacteroidota bacterium]MCK6611456.1 enoyl-CoA hydratase-related protein [Bacteroidia bacterium]